MESKICTKCKIDKPSKDFRLRMDKKLNSWCKKCHTAWGVNKKRNTPAYREKAAITRRKYDLLKKYGLTVEEWNELLLQQNGVCKICKEPKRNKTHKYLVVDHCHKTNKIRGLLCDSCNRAIGLFKDNVELMLKAIEYLQDITPKKQIKIFKNDRFDK